MVRNKIDKTKQITKEMKWTKKLDTVQTLKQTIGLSPISTKSGITLVSLVVTIILMLILAGIVLSLTIGENGPIGKAQLAGKEYQDATQREKEELVKLDGYITGENLPENTKDTQAGTLVAIPDKWKTDTPNYVETEHGNTVVTTKRVSSVAAVAVGNGETVPVPLGFYYVGGNLESGVVISDNSADQNKYAGQADVPSGLKVNDDNTIGYELVGNQFVWIPCELDEYVKTNWGQGNVANRSNACWDTTIGGTEKMQTEKYGGFYVGRYEAGLASDIEEYTTSQPYNNGANQIYNKEGVPESKPGKIPWTFIDWTTSQKNAERMYKTSYVKSGLITGAQWDVMINKIASVEGKNITNSGDWGNHLNTLLTYTGRYATYNTSNEYLSTFSEKQINGTKNANTYTLLTTGSTEQVKGYNLYDVAGNVWEWTEEYSAYGGNSATQYRMLRGSSCYRASGTSPVCYRLGHHTVNNTDSLVGFRVVLYIK